jgi:Mrp family chromosome partitioning ATPase
VQALNQQIAQTEATLNGQTGAALSSISEAEVSAQSEVNELSANLDALKAQAAGQSTAEAEYRSLSDEADSARTVYETFLEHANEVVDRAALLQPPVIFVSHAGVPLRPTFPDKTKLGLGVIVLALAAGAAAAFARDHFSDGFDEAEVLRAHAQEPILATLPWLPNPRPKKIARHILDEPFSQTGDAVRGLAAKLSLLAPDAHAPRSILVTSASPLEGKSTLALWLVMTMRQGGHDVLLIDGDHRRGSLLSGATSQGKPGFTDYLAGGVRAADLIQKDTATGIDFIPSGNAMSRPFGPDEIDRLRELLMAMKQTYKIVVIDSPPLLAIADGFVHASVVDQTVFVCRWQQTSRRAVTASLDRLRQYGARVAGLVVTMVDPGAVTDFDGLYSRREQYLITQLYGT